MRYLEVVGVWGVARERSQRTGRNNSPKRADTWGGGELIGRNCRKAFAGRELVVKMSWRRIRTVSGELSVVRGGVSAGANGQTGRLQSAGLMLCKLRTVVQSMYR